MIKNLDDFKYHILIGTPCYGGVLHEGYMHSMIATIMKLPDEKINTSLKTITNESLVTRARNHIADAFLCEKRFTHLLFIDADISFTPEQISRMVNFDKPLVIGSYPHKAYDWTSIYNIIKNKKDLTIPELEASILRYSGSMVSEKGPDDKMNVIQKDGFVKGWWDCPTGFMMIRRDVFEKMIDVIGTQIEYINDLPQTSDDGLSVVINEKKQYAFFNAEVDPKTRRYLSEDYTFCKRWIEECDGEIWIDTNSVLTHTGTWSFKGNLITYLKNNNFQVNQVSEKYGQLVAEQHR